MSETKISKRKMEELLRRLIKAVGDCEDTEEILAIVKDAEAILEPKNDRYTKEISVLVHEFLDPVKEVDTESRKVFGMPCMRLNLKAVYEDRRLSFVELVNLEKA